MQEVIRFGNVRASNDLIEHLNANKLHYSQAIYRSLDASSLALLLSPYSYEGKPVVQLIDPTPVTVSANYLVFKMHEEEFEPTEEGEDGERLLSEWGKWLKDHGISKSRVKTDLIPLPSGGVFAEAVLGRYNAAEKLDMTRFWNWQDSPIPIAAPEIAPVEVTSRGTPEDLKPGQLGAPVVSIVNPTALPDPTGLPAVLQAIQNGNMFRDMSGLAATMALAQTGMSAASQGATAAGAQAGTNAAVAAQLLSDLAKTAASVLTMGVGGAIGGAAGGLLGAGGGSGGGGNISNAGALINQGRSMTQRSAGGSVSGGGGGSGVRMGGSDGGAPTGGGFADNGTDSGSGGGAPFGGSADFEAQAFNRALWGQAGESGADSARLMLASAIPDLGVVGDLKNPISVLLGGDDYLKPLPVDEVHAWYQRLAQSIRKQDADSLAADLLEKWLDGGGGLFVYQPRNPDQNRIFTSPFVLDYLRQRVRPVFLTEGKGRNAGKEKWLGLIPRIQKLPGFPAWDGTSPITMTYKGESVEIPLQVQVDALRGKGRREDLDLLYALHDFAIQTEVVVKLIRRGTTMVHDVNFEKWESKALDRYDWDPTKHITVPNPDYKNVFGVAKPVAPGEEMITVYHTNAKRLEAAGLAKPFNFESGVWTPTNDPTIDGPAVIDASKVLN